MTKNERKGLLIGIGLFSFFISTFIRDLLDDPLTAFFIGFMLLTLIISFIVGTKNKSETTTRKAVPIICNNDYRLRIDTVRKKRLSMATVEKLRKMDPYKFEEYIRDLLLLSGYKKAQCTSRSNDGGKDIVAQDKENRLVFVECKRYDENNRVGRPLIQKFHSAMIDGKADIGLFVTTGYFNKNAVKYSHGKNIELIDARKLSDMIHNLAQQRK